MAIPTSLWITQGHVPLQFAPAQLQRTSSFWKDEGFAPADIAVAAGQITALGQIASSSTAAQLDASDCVVLPGFIDVHVHGAVGYDTMDASALALEEMARFYATHGVTGFLPTTMTASPQATMAAVRAVAAHTQLPPSGARIMGIHVEGPYISPQFPGAQLADAIRPPALDEFTELIAAGPVRMITLAPELRGAHQLIRAARAQDITVATGHTAATYDECEEGFGVGVNQATHTYNAMSGLHHRRPGTLGAVLANDNIYAQLIADNIHVHPTAMKILARCKGVSHTILITDAMRAAGLEAGQYDLGGQMVTVREGQCRLADGTLAGSVLTLECALANFLAASGLSLAEAWPTTSQTAATSLGIDDQWGSIATGYHADLVLLDEQLAVVATIVAGNVVYLREPERLQPDASHKHAPRSGLE